ncbi:MAG: hypothetical protein JWO36_6426 [Myxococcales bacterium]|nr:hypothetical protein [Myxococcales bacterium]
MIKHASLAAFVATIVVAVPAGWRSLDADIQTDGPALRPTQQSLTIGDATVTIDVDRGIMRAGDTVSAVLVASSPRVHAVTVEVTALQDEGFGGERVPNPPNTVGRRKIKLQAAPGGGPPVVASFSLGSHRAKPGRLEWFSMFVAPTGQPAPDRMYVRDDQVAASMGVATWTGNSFPISIEPPAIIPFEGAFTVAVRIRNTTNQPFEYSQISLGGQIAGYDSMDSDLELGATDDFEVAPIPNDEQSDIVEVGAEHVAIFKLTPMRPDVTHFTLVARAKTGYATGAMDALSFDRPATPVEDHPASVASQP